MVICVYIYNEKRCLKWQQTLCLFQSVSQLVIFDLKPNVTERDESRKKTLVLQVIMLSAIVNE